MEPNEFTNRKRLRGCVVDWAKVKSHENTQQNTFSKRRLYEQKQSWKSLRRLTAIRHYAFVSHRNGGRFWVEWNTFSMNEIEIEAPHKFYRCFSLFANLSRWLGLSYSKVPFMRPACIEFIASFSLLQRHTTCARCFPADFADRARTTVVCRLHYYVSSNNHYYCHYIVSVDWAGVGDVAYLYCHWQIIMRRQHRHTCSPQWAPNHSCWSCRDLFRNGKYCNANTINKIVSK